MAVSDIVPVILCGGSGTRLWPLSRTQSPKQFLALQDGKSPFEGALGRGLSVCATGTDGQPPLLCVTVEAQKYLVQAALGALGAEADILVEPVGRNTTASICLAALWLARRRNKAIMVVLPGDHLFEEEKEWQQAVLSSVRAAEKGRLVCLGIKPENPSSRFGYVKAGKESKQTPGVYATDGFLEKPDSKTAKKLCRQGWLWNAGIFVVQAQTVLEMIAEHAPAVFFTCCAAMETPQVSDGFTGPDADLFDNIPALQFDRAVLEKSDRVSLVPYLGKWRDVGDWQAIEQLADLDKDGNRLSGDVIANGCRQAYVRSAARLVVALGLEDIMIIDTPDALLVAHKSALDGLGKVVDQLGRDNRVQAEVHLRVERPWGYYDVKESKPGFKVKCVLVRPGAALSSQFHRYRCEHWIVVKGTAWVTVDGQGHEVGVNESIFIPCGIVHRLENRTKDPLELVEVQTGSYLGEDDIVRLDDDYGRV